MFWIFLKIIGYADRAEVGIDALVRVFDAGVGEVAIKPFNGKAPVLSKEIMHADPALFGEIELRGLLARMLGHIDQT